MTSKADQLLANLGEAQRKVVAAERALEAAREAERAAVCARGDAIAEVRAALDAIEREAAGL